jgi:hypothetical protein
MNFARSALALLFLASVARADEDPEANPAPAPPAHSHFTVAFAGGELFPSSRMQTGPRTTNQGLDVWSRIGWNAANGLGLVMNLEYAPLRHQPTEGLSPDTQIDGHMFAATAAPRFTIGHRTVRVWLSAGGGIVVERVHTETPGTSLSTTEVGSAFAVHGSGGIDLHLFGSGGLQVAGGYTRSLSDSTYDFFSVNAGLVFTM